MDNVKIASELVRLAKSLVARVDAQAAILDAFGGLPEQWEDVEIIGDSRYSVVIGKNTAWRKWYGAEVDVRPQIWEGLRSRKALLDAIKASSGLTVAKSLTGAVELKRTRNTEPLFKVMEGEVSQDSAHSGAVSIVDAKFVGQGDGWLELKVGTDDNFAHNIRLNIKVD